MPNAIRFHQTGGPEVLQWESVAVGEPGPGEARVRHTAIGLNYIDTYHRSGLYKLPLPSGIGLEAAGVVARSYLVNVAVEEEVVAVASRDANGSRCCPALRSRFSPSGCWTPSPGRVPSSPITALRR